MSKNLVLYNGRVHTLNARNPAAEALTVRDDRILAVGSSQDMLSLAGSGASCVDLAGRLAIPGFEDAHVHFCTHGLALRQLELGGALSLEDALARVQSSADAHRPSTGQWILGRGWNHNLWPNPVQPTRHDLDRVAKHIPVALRSKDGHSTWANSAALRSAGIDASMPDPPGGRILRDLAGEPTGILVERAADLLSSCLPKPSPSAMAEAARSAVADAARLGVTSAHNCEGAESFHSFERLAQAGELTVRIWHMIALQDLSEALARGLRTGQGNSLLRVGHLKMLADGALGSYTAEMLAPYEDHPDAYGVAVTDSEELYQAARAAAQGKVASAIHAIGDGANRRVLDIYERLAAEGLTAGLRQRIEHVQLLSPEDLPRLARLGVIASMQPIHATQAMEMADRHWGNRARLSYAWRSLLDSGAVLAFGTDCPVESLNPLAGLYAACTRRRCGTAARRCGAAAQRADGTLQEGWYPEERLTLGQALYAYTMGSAYASGEEQDKGSLAPGKMADIVVLSRDIFAGPPEAILDTVVDMTIVGGRVVYER